MPTPTLKYVAPTTPEDDLTFAPEPVVIYGVPSGGGGGGAVDSVNGQTGVVVLDIPETPEDIGAATAAQGTLASTAVQPAALSSYVPTTRTVAGKALSANVTLVKGDVGLGSVDNTADSAKPVSTATQTALNGKASTVHTHVATDISDSTSLGRSILSAASITAARAALGIVVSPTDPGGADGTLWFRTP